MPTLNEFGDPITGKRIEDLQPEQGPLNQFGDPIAPKPVERGGLAAASLPVPTSDMFNEMDDADAAKTYEAYFKHPDTQRQEDGTLVYKGQVVPKPESTSGFVGGVKALAGAMMNPMAPVVKRLWPGSAVDKAYDTSVNLAEGVGAGTAVNIPRNIAVGATALGSKALENIGAIDNESANKAVNVVKETLPSYNPEGGAEALGAIGAEVVGGIALGNKAAGAMKAAGVATPVIAKIAEKAPTIINYMTSKFITALGAGAGLGAVVNGENDTALVGENSALGQLDWTKGIDERMKEQFPILRGFDTTSPDEAQNTLNARLNVIMDSMILAMPLEMGADAGKFVFKAMNEKIFSPILETTFPSIRERHMMERFMTMVGQAVDPQNPQSEKAIYWQKKIVESLQDPEFKQIFLGGVKNEDGTITSAMREGIQPINVKRDVASTINRSLKGDDSLEAAAIRNIFEEQRKTLFDEGGIHVQTKTQAQEPVAAAKRVLSQTDEVLGGADNMERGAAKIREMAKIDANSMIDEADRKMAEVADEAAKYPDIVRSHALGEQMDETGKALPSSAGLKTDEIRAGMRESLDTGTEKVIAENKALWEAVPDGIPVDEPALAKAVEDAGEWMTPKIRKRFARAGFNVPEGEVAFDATDQAVLDAIDASELVNIPDGPIDLKNLQKLRSVLSDEIDALAGNGVKGKDSEGMAALIKLREHIGEYQVDQAIKSGHPGAQAVKAAADHTREVKGPMLGDAVPLKVRQKIPPTLRKATDTGKDIKEGIIADTLTSEFPNEQSHFINLLADERFGQKQGLVVDYAISKASDNLRVKLVGAVDGISEIKPQEIIQSFEPYRKALNRNPELYAKELERMDKFETELLTNYKNIAKMKKLADDYAGKAIQYRDEMYTTVYKDFIDKYGKELPSGYQNFETLFSAKHATGPQAAGNVDKIVQLAEASGDPAVMDAMKVAWVKQVNKKAFTGTNQLSTEGVNDMLTGDNNLFLIGEKIFKDEDKVILDAVREVFEPALEVTVSTKGKKFAESAGQLPANLAKGAVSKAVRLRYGPLTRKGTSINTIASTIIETLDPNNRAMKILDGIMADPDEFVKLYNRVAKYPVEFPVRVWEWGLKTGIYNESDKNVFDKKFRRLNSGLEFERMMRDQEAKTQKETQKKR